MHAEVSCSSSTPGDRKLEGRFQRRSENRITMRAHAVKRVRMDQSVEADDWASMADGASSLPSSMRPTINAYGYGFHSLQSSSVVLVLRSGTILTYVEDPLVRIGLTHHGAPAAAHLRTTKERSEGNMHSAQCHRQDPLDSHHADCWVT
jgi:hypothetical protein